MSTRLQVVLDDLPEELRQYVPAGAKGMELARWGFQLVRLQRDLEKGQEAAQFGSLAGLINQNHAAGAKALDDMKEQVVESLLRVRDVEEQSARALLQVKGIIAAHLSGVEIPESPAPGKPALSLVRAEEPAPAEIRDPNDPFAKVIDGEIKLSDDDLHTVCTLAVDLLPPELGDRAAAAIKVTQELVAGTIMSSQGLLQQEPWTEIPSRGADEIIKGNLKARGVLPKEDSGPIGDDDPAWVSDANDEPADP